MAPPSIADNYREDLIYLGELPVHIKTFGKWIGDNLSDTKEIVLFVPGIIGLTGFYAKFLSIIYKELGSSIPVWMIGHTGCDEPPVGDPKDTLNLPRLKGNEHLYNYEAQIQYKLEFIRKYVPRHVKIHLIGHSAGAWIATQLLKYPYIKSKIKKTYLLFPVIERAGETPNGKYISGFVAQNERIILSFLALFNILPYILKAFIVYVYFFYKHIDKTFLDTMIKFLRVQNVEISCSNLGNSLISDVNELEVDLLKENSGILKLYYGENDDWTPTNFYREIKEKIPQLDVVIGDKNIAHSFVLRSSVPMGKIVSKWIKEN